MKKWISFLLEAVMILSAGAALYMCENYAVYNLVYIFIFVFIAFYAVVTPAAVSEKIVKVILYALILAAQIVFNTLIIRTMNGDRWYNLCRFSGVLVSSIPFLVRVNFFHQTAQS